jgi:ribosomal protein S27E
VLHERVGDHFEGEIFRFDCPSCGETLQTDTCRQGQSNAGTRVACLFCRQVITIPPIGVSPLERVLS